MRWTTTWGMPGTDGFDMGMKFREHADKMGVEFRESVAISIEDKQDSNWCIPGKEIWRQKRLFWPPELFMPL